MKWKCRCLNCKNTFYKSWKYIETGDSYKCPYCDSIKFSKYSIKVENELKNIILIIF